MVLAAVVASGKLFVRFRVCLSVVKNVLHDCLCKDAVVATTADEELAVRELVEHHQGFLLLRLLIGI
jgi:hypothetical protein